MVKVIKNSWALLVSSLILLFFLINTIFADTNFQGLKDKKVSYLDFFLLKYESTLMRKASILAAQMVPTRVQYSNIGVGVKYDDKKKQINTEFHAIMDKYRYSKRKYDPKKRDCNQVRNLIFYKKHGYKFFSQKRDPNLSVDIMENLFKENFFENYDFSKQEIDFLLSKMFVKVTIFHPINKTKLSCSGKINDYELN